MDPAAGEYSCPHCQQTVDVQEVPEHGVVTCPHCSGEFSLPEPVAEEDQEVELDGLKIRQLSTMRRTAYRGRSYAIIAAAACAVVAVQLIWLSIRHVYTIGWGVWPIGYLLLVPLALWGAWHFLERAQSLGIESKRSALDEPTTAPDFSSLSDGSQHAKNLEEMQ